VLTRVAFPELPLPRIVIPSAMQSDLQGDGADLGSIRTSQSNQ